jgi:hypothetical protein
MIFLMQFTMVNAQPNITTVNTMNIGKFFTNGAFTFSYIRCENWFIKSQVLNFDFVF